MTIEQAKEELRVLSQAKQYFAKYEKRRVDSIDVNKRDFFDINGRDALIKQIQSLDIAIKSLDMWDKVMGEIENLTYYWCEVNPKSVIDDVLQIIEKYKKEIEK